MFFGFRKRPKKVLEGTYSGTSLKTRKGRTYLHKELSEYQNQEIRITIEILERKTPDA